MDWAEDIASRILNIGWSDEELVIDFAAALRKAKAAGLIEAAEICERDAPGMEDQCGRGAFESAAVLFRARATKLEFSPTT